MNHRQFKELLNEVENECGDVMYFLDVRWLSRGKILVQFYNLIKKIYFFLQMKGQHYPDLDVKIGNQIQHLELILPPI